MSGWSGFTKSIAAHQNAVNPSKLERGDVIDNEGLIVCGTCGQKKQLWITVEGERIKVPCICDCRKKQIEEQERKAKEAEEQQKIERLRSASLMPGKFAKASFDRYFLRAENERAFKVANSYVENFDKMVAMNQGLLFYGDVGTGKSYTAACIANAVMNKRKSVIMTSFVKLLQDFQKSDTESGFIRALNNTTLVIIDDFGAERSTDYALEKVYNVIDSRVRANKPLILTTNLDRRDMEYTPDIRYKRIYDRIFEVCYPVEMRGRSLRMARAAANERRMKELLEQG